MENRLLIDYYEAKMSLKRTHDISPNDCRYKVYVKFYCEPSLTNHIIRPHSREPLIQRTNQPHIETVDFNFDYDDDEKAGRERIDRELREWPLHPKGRRWLIDCAMKDVQELFECMPPHHNTLILKFWVRANDVRVHYEQEEEDVWMVPADHESPIDCSICLDEISSGAEGLTCGHVFHEDCINKWLKTSHSCPVCRYQMHA
ncbi:hypothetical protein CASFOL_012738 [Castilleja foliolosa]|uniref:RING-type E3 ubiquitin transferase n=1 Tax=Castilleja foliolosa TaxID=1961234 RepID=A0ABD3DHY7_9LAMI